MTGTASRMTLMTLYQARNAPGDIGKNARALLEQTDWFIVNTDFDPKTGKALPQLLSAFLTKLAWPSTARSLHDRLWRITEHARPSVERLFHTLAESPRREHALLPVRAVRELDAASFMKLCTRPGRTIREKLAGKPYIQAVRRYQSVDLPENRLLKAFVIRLAELLELRQDCLGEPEDELLPKIQSWLRTDEVQSIGRWENLPPNNTLLSHRDYRRVWDAWRWLQTLDDDIDRDFSQLDMRSETVRYWSKYATMYREGAHRFAEMPVLFDFDRFEIRPWTSQLAIWKARKPVPRKRAPKKEVVEPVCIDLVIPRPRYATASTPAACLNDTFLWQQWRSDSERIDIELFNSDATYLHPDATSVASSDLFFCKDNAPDHLDRAARAFAFRLRESFKDDSLIWLVPDFLNDFELAIIRRNLNARYRKAEPLPRSVAAAFEQVDYSNITNNEYSIVVVDTIGGKTSVTKLIARFDKQLRKRLPETKGFYWERCPPVIITREDFEIDKEKGYDLITVDSKGHWHNATPPAKPHFIEPSSLKNNPQVGKFAFCINLKNSPVAGGIRLHALQELAGDIPLWRDRIPELSIKVMKEGRYRRFNLVSRGQTITPVRGRAVRVTITEHFTLPAGKPFYQFPLYQGENAAELSYSARLDSSAFPLKSNTVCELILTFEYGADDPYTLIFAPRDKSFPPVRATWQRTEIITDAPAPDYPEPMSWADLRSVPKPDSEATRDLLEWVLDAIERLGQSLFRSIGEITSDWREDTSGKCFTFAWCDDVDEDVLIHESFFVQGLSYEDLKERDELSFELQERGGRYFGRKVARVDFREPTHAVRLRTFDENVTQCIVKNIRKSLYFPIIQVWRDGRSIGDAACPSDFSDTMPAKIEYLASLLQDAGIPNRIQREVLFLLACMHKDIPDECVQWISEQVESGNIRDPRAVGFALGDVSEQWQEYVLSKLAVNPTKDALRVFAYAIWREQHFVQKFTLSELKSILNGLSSILGQLKSCPPRSRKNKWAVRKWARTTAESLELLLGLLRTRDSDDPDIRMLLQPHRKITKQFAEQIDRVEDIIAESNVMLFSRVQIDIQKPEGVRTPDLLYALRLYLTGDDGANAIRIASISDGDDN